MALVLGGGAVLTVNQLYEARLRAVRIPLPSDPTEGDQE